MDLHRLAEGLRASGHDGRYVAGSRGMMVLDVSTGEEGWMPDEQEREPEVHFCQVVDGMRWLRTWDGRREDPLLAFFFRDEVRRVAPGSFAIPILNGCSILAHDESGGWLPSLLDWLLRSNRANALKGSNETQAWANAFLALHDAGLLLKGEAA